MRIVLLIILLFMLVGGIVFIIYRRMNKGALLVVEDELGQEQASLPPGLFSSTLFSSEDGQYSGQVTMIGPALWVSSSTNRLLSSKIILGEGKIVLESMIDDDAIRYTFRIRKSESAAGEEAVDRYSSHDEWGGADS